MLFNSLDYIALLAVSLLFYWLSPSLRLRQLIVFVASVAFYVSWSQAFMLMLLILIGINWLLGWQVSRHRSRLWIGIACILNLGLLAWFKYANFFAANIAWLGQEAGWMEAAPHWQMILPLGISFFMFEIISYLVDIQRGKIAHERNPLIFANFILFFPHLIAGPICRAGQLMPQLRTYQSLKLDNIYNGLYLFLCGLVLKVAIADGLAPFVNVIFKAPANYSGLENSLGAIGFGIQILCDFWGYSLMALGSGLLFGYALPPNFNAPYAATSIRTFWHRWHMTLSSWLRDYLYIPLGGSRVDRAWKIQRNLFITMLLGGLWHGANWTFIIWGALHGTALIINHTFEKWLPQGATRLFRWPPVGWLLTMLVAFTGWIFFRAWQLDDALLTISQIVTPAANWLDMRIRPVFFELLLLFVGLNWLIHRTTYGYDMALARPVKQMAMVALLTLVAFIYYVDSIDFIYFQF